MKVRESGMPDEEIWETFFSPPDIFRALGIDSSIRDLAEFGCGYGTFTLPAAESISGSLYAIEIDPRLISIVKDKIRIHGVRNVLCIHRDFMSEGTGLDDDSVDYVMLFNILHDERPDRILREAYRIVKPGGKIGIIHWNYDQSTPRGPPLEIRPRPGQCREWAEEAGFRYITNYDLKPYHYGLVFLKALLPVNS
jgi:SAM-dependent methyltransferase